MAHGPTRRSFLAPTAPSVSAMSGMEVPPCPRMPPDTHAAAPRTREARVQPEGVVRACEVHCVPLIWRGVFQRAGKSQRGESQRGESCEVRARRARAAPTRGLAICSVVRPESVIARSMAMKAYRAFTARRGTRVGAPTQRREMGREAT
eukprot:4368899-Prymnesium_polylepis.1